MILNTTQEARYIPEWHGNREEPESSQIVVEFTCLSHDQRKKHIQREKPEMTYKNIDAKTDEEIDAETIAKHAEMKVRFYTDDEGIVKDMRPRIRNLEDENGNPIDTWAKLVAVPVTPDNDVESLVREILVYLSSAAKEKDKKK